MKRVFPFLIVLFSFFAQGEMVMRSYAKKLDLSRRFVDASVDMLKYDMLNVLVKNEGSEPRVIWDEEASSQCLALDIKTTWLNGNKYRIQLTPDYNLDDGANECVVHIKQPSKRTATVSFGFNIDD